MEKLTEEQKQRIMDRIDIDGIPGLCSAEELKIVKKEFRLKLEKFTKESKYCFFITKISKEKWEGDDVNPDVIGNLEGGPLEIGADLFDAKKIKSITHTPIFAYEELGILTTIIYE